VIVLFLPESFLGSSFEEISVNMIELIEKFYKENGKYPRSWGDHAYNDIGWTRMNGTRRLITGSFTRPEESVYR